MELTWITFPIWVVLVSAGAYALAMYTKGDELRLNQVDLVDVDVQSGMARGTSWLICFRRNRKRSIWDWRCASRQGDGRRQPAIALLAGDRRHAIRRRVGRALCRPI